MPNRIIFFSKIFLAIFLAAGFLFFNGNLKNNSAHAQEGDAIAVRVLPNPEHYNPLDWYFKQGFKGSPAPLKVDGYEAVRDDRTVYVNVANVGGACLQSKKSCLQNSDCTSKYDPCMTYLFTNIYLISFNQEAAPETAIIFDNILSKWHFNTNVSEPGICFVPPNPGNSENPVKCWIDSDCASGFCDSKKAKIIRDIKRLGDIVALREKLKNYLNINQAYPKLSSGTYLPGKTISTWPSWEAEFSSALGLAAPLDPINKLGDCTGYDSTTCWNDQNKKFAGNFNSGDVNDFVLPENSRALVYSTDAKGSEYKLCSYMESGFMIGDSDAACLGSAPLNNNPPVISCGEMAGIAGQEFSGYVKVSDSEDDPITIEISGLSDEFSFSNTANKNEKKILSNPAPKGIFTFDVKAYDAQNTATKKCTINISSQARVIYPIADQRILSGKALNFSIYANDSEKKYNNLSFSFSSSPTLGLACKSPITITNDGRAKCDISISSNVPQKYQISVSAKNEAGGDFTVQKFNLEFYNTPPVIAPFNCDKTLRVSTSTNQGEIINYKNCTIHASDPDGHRIKDIEASGLPAGMFFSAIDTLGNRVLSGHSTAAGISNMEFVAVDEYGARSAPAKLQLKIVNYCGDGIKQSPNSEGQGGVNNDGYESCDKKQGLPLLTESNATWQYGCDKNCKSLFAGFCGDGKIQADYGEECDFGAENDCCKKCKWTTGPTKPYSFPDFTITSGGTKNLTLPLSRGIVDGNITASKNTSEAIIVFNSDLSHNLYLSMSTHKEALKNAIDDLFDESNKKQANVYVGLVGFGNCYKKADGTPDYSYMPANEKGYIAREYGIINLKNNYNGKEDLKKYIDQQYIACENFVADHNGNSGAPQGISYANQMLQNFSNPGKAEKYMVLLTDGIVSNDNTQTNYALATTNAQKAKDSGVKLYAVAYAPTNSGFYAIGISSMCKWSSDNGANCYSGGYSYVRDFNLSDLTQLAAIFEKIKEKIVDNLEKIPYTIGDVSGSIDSATGSTFTLPNVKCDLSGKTLCKPSNLNFSATFAGNNPMGFKISLNILPLCE